MFQIDSKEFISDEVIRIIQRLLRYGDIIEKIYKVTLVSKKKHCKN